MGILLTLTRTAAALIHTNLAKKALVETRPMLRDTQALLYFDWFARVDALTQDYLLLRSTLWHGYLTWSTIVQQHQNFY